MEEIKNYDVYVQGMEKSLKDKLFFLDMVQDVNTLVDFGCANGSFLEYVKRNKLNWKLIGIDNNKLMIERAKSKIPNGKFFLEKDIPASLSSIAEKTVLNMSSVIHELYTYSSANEVCEFWNHVFETGFKYIAIRDLMLSVKSYRESKLHDNHMIKFNSSGEQLRDFTSVWGDINKQNNLLHFLMKYRYVENWDREVTENYFPITIEEFLSQIPTNLYRIIYFEHYILPFNKEKIAEDFGIDLLDNTHVKLLLERRRCL